MRKRTNISRFGSLMVALLLLPYLFMSFAAGRCLTYLIHDHHDRGHHTHSVPETEVANALAWHDDYLHVTESLPDHSVSVDYTDSGDATTPTFILVSLHLESIALPGQNTELQLDSSSRVKLPVTAEPLIFCAFKDNTSRLKNSLTLSGAPPQGPSHVVSILLSSHAILV